MSELRMVSRPALQRPVLIAAFRGWNDGGQGATLAAGYLARIWDAERFADIDPELAQRVQRLAVQVHTVLRLRDYSRIDFVVDALA